MDKKTGIVPLPPRPQQKERIAAPLAIHQQKRSVRLAIWLGSILVVGIIVAALISMLASAWVRNVKLPTTQSLPTPNITTFAVQRTAPYAGLDMTVVNVQYAPSFTDDTIHAGPAVVRLSMYIANHTKDQSNVVYYDIARLLAPKLSSIAPTNVHLSVGPAPSASENGWIDFSVPANLALNTLTLQLGSPLMHETLVKIPFTSPYNSNQYANHSSPQTLLIAYNFFGHTLNYHLTSVDVRYSYQGTQCKAGQQFYVFNFLIDNPEGGDISPGFGFDYVRFVLNGGNLPPIDNSLPYSFKANAISVGGHVVFTAPVGLKNLTIGFLSQDGNGQQNFNIGLS